MIFGAEKCLFVHQSVRLEIFGAGNASNEHHTAYGATFGAERHFFWHQNWKVVLRGMAGKDSRMGNDLIDIGRGDYRKTAPQERGL